MQTIRKLSKVAIGYNVDFFIGGKGLLKSNSHHFTSKIRNYLINEKNPYNVGLFANYKKSWAYYSMNVRVPKIVQQIVDGLVRDRGEIAHKYGNGSKEELKNIIRAVSRLKIDIQTNKEYRMFDLPNPDKMVWNNSLCELGDKNTYFTSPWIFTECYIYRRIREIFLEQPSVKFYDYFKKQKDIALLSQFGTMQIIAKHIDENRTLLKNNPGELEQFFATLVKLNLWSNQMDLSISDGQQQNASQDPLASVIIFDKSILVNDIGEIWKCLSDPAINHNTTIVDFVCDNAGYELFMDLCIGDFLLENCLTNCIRFHVKLIPFFISDTMPADFLWTLTKLRTHSDKYLAKLGQRCSNYLQDGRFQLMKEHFWTNGYCYNRLQEIDSGLYNTLGEAHLIIFKGDMNYRKLLDIHWEPCTPFEVTLRGFRPSNLCSIRTVKAELICGLKEGVQEIMDAKDPKWMVTGEYGVIHFARKDNKCLK